jgi:hypothetical protein
VHPILKKLAGGDRRSRGKSDEVAQEASHAPDLFAVLVDGMTGDDPVIRMRAADAVEKASRIFPRLLDPHKRRFLKDVAELEQQEVRWHLAQIVPRLRLNRRERQACVTLLKSYLIDRSKIVQVSAMQGLADLALQDDRLRKSVSDLVESLIVDGSPAVKARGRKLQPILRGDAARHVVRVHNTL